MSKVTLALGSFIVGAICGSFALSLIHTSTRVQAFQNPGVATINMPGAEPVVPPIRTFMTGGRVAGAVQGLDGLACDGCTIAVPVLTYGGGAFNLTNPKFPGPVRIELRGAATNTFNLLRAIGAIPTPQPPPQPPRAEMKTAALEIKANTNGNLVSLEGLNK
jgi:hypothetical protein